MELSVVIPVYGCKEALPELHRRLTETVSSLVKDYEIILVEDACPQNSWEVIAQLCDKDPHVIGIRFSRNFGQIRAITAGLDYSTGDYVVVMDCDLQDRPEVIADLYKKAQEGYDVVFASRVDRQDTKKTKLLSRLYYKVYDYFTEGRADYSLCNFSISRRIVIDEYCKMREQNRSFTMFIQWLGFRQTSIEAIGDERYSGQSSYTFQKKMKLAFEIITTQSNKPLMLSVKVGFSIAFLAFVYILYLVLRALIWQDVLMGWTTIVASIYLMGGVLLGAIGIVGIYVGNIFNETKHRPLYVISQIKNERKKE